VLFWIPTSRSPTSAEQLAFQRAAGWLGVAYFQGRALHPEQEPASLMQAEGQPAREAVDPNKQPHHQPDRPVGGVDQSHRRF